MEIKTAEEPEVDHGDGNDGIKAPGVGGVPTQSQGSTCSIRMVEFFSGIGGFRLGVERAMSAHAHGQHGRQANGNGSDEHSRSEAGASSSNYRLEACHAYEISLNANDTYKHNFHRRHDESLIPYWLRLNSLPVVRS